MSSFSGMIKGVTRNTSGESRPDNENQPDQPEKSSDERTAPADEQGGQRVPKNKSSQLSSFFQKKLPKNETGLLYNVLEEELSALAGRAGSSSVSQLEILLPRLALFGRPAPSAATSFLRLLESTDDRRILRYAYYFLERIVGERRADQGKVVDALMDNVVLAVAKDTSNSSVNRRQVALRLLNSAAAAGSSTANKELKKAVVEIIGHLARKTKSKSRFKKFLGSSKSGADSGEAAPPAVQRSSFAAVRSSLAGDEDLELQAVEGAKWAKDPIAARHALAIAAAVAKRSPDKVASKLQHSLHIRFSATDTSTFGEVHAPAAESSEGKDSKGEGGKTVLDATDTLARIHLCEVCGEVVHAPTLQGKPELTEPFWAILMHLVGDQHLRVALEAIRALAASNAVGDLAPQMQAAAWAKLIGCSTEAGGRGSRSSPETPSSSQSGMSKTRAAVVRRLVGGMQKGASEATIAACCSGMGALARAHAHWDKSSDASAARPRRRSKSKSMFGKLKHTLINSNKHKDRREESGGDNGDSESGAREQDGREESLQILEKMAEALEEVLAQGSSVAVCAGVLCSLTWLRTPSHLGHFLPLLQEHLRSEGLGWTQALLHDLLQGLRARLVASPALAPEMLAACTAVVEAAPQQCDPDAIVDIWKAALAAAPSPQVTLDAVHEHVVMLQQQEGAGGGEAMAAAAAVSGARAAAVQHAVAAFWFLGEHGNYAAAEYAWAPAPAAEEGVEHGKVLLLDRNPPLVRAISDLQQAAVQCAWPARVEAVRALGKVAVRSGEPFRFQCYTVLKAANAGPLGLAAATRPILSLLDRLYSSQLKWLHLVDEHGTDLKRWPTQSLFSVAKWHEDLLKQVSCICFVPVDKYLPLGPDSGPAIKAAEKCGYSGARAGGQEASAPPAVAPAAGQAVTVE